MGRRVKGYAKSQSCHDFRPLYRSSDLRKANANRDRDWPQVREYLFRDAHLKLNTEKGQLFQRERLCLGHIVLPKGIATNPYKLTTMRELPL